MLFTTTLNQMLVLVTFIAIGFILQKCKIVPDNASTVVSKLEYNLPFLTKVISGLYTYSIPFNYFPACFRITCKICNYAGSNYWLQLASLYDLLSCNATWIKFGYYSYCIRKRHFGWCRACVILAYFIGNNNSAYI